MPNQKPKPLVDPRNFPNLLDSVDVMPHMTIRIETAGVDDTIVDPEEREALFRNKWAFVKDVADSVDAGVNLIRYWIRPIGLNMDPDAEFDVIAEYGETVLGFYLN